MSNSSFSSSISSFHYFCLLLVFLPLLSNSSFFSSISSFHCFLFVCFSLCYVHSLFFLSISSSFLLGVMWVSSLHLYITPFSILFFFLLSLRFLFLPVRHTCGHTSSCLPSPRMSSNTSPSLLPFPLPPVTQPWRARERTRCLHLPPPLSLSDTQVR